MRLVAYAVAGVFMLTGTAVAATTLAYSFSGIADYGDIAIYTSNALTGGFDGTPIFASPIGLAVTGSFSLSVSDLPPMVPSGVYYAYYNVAAAAPAFLTSASSATFDGYDLGVATAGTYYSQIQVGGFDPDYQAYFADYTGDYFGNPVRDYYEDGSLKSRTSYYAYNSLSFETNAGRLVDGRPVPIIGTGARYTIESYFAQERFANDGTFLGTQLAYWTIGASGVLTTTGAGAVPEPASWTLFISGFGLVGSFMRGRQRACGQGSALKL